MQKLWTMMALVALAGVGFAQNKIGDCEVTGQKGQFPIRPVSAGVLTVQTNLPAPGWWNGDTPDTIKSGLEYCLAANIAWRAGLERVQIVNVSFDALVAGQTRAFDLAFSQITITDARKRVVDFSVPYFSSDQGVLVRRGAIVTERNIRTLRVGAQAGTTAVDLIQQTLKVPSSNVRVFPDTPTLFAALAARQVDAAILDTAIVLEQAGRSNGQLVVVGQYKTGEEYGALYPKGSANRATFDRIMQALIADGTVRRLTAKYLGGDPSSVPVFKP